MSDVDLCGLMVSPVEDPRSGQLRGRLRLRSISSEGESFAASQRVQLLFPGEGAELSYGDIVRVSGLLRHPRPARNPGEFDERSFLRQRGVAAEIVAAWKEDVVRTGSGGGNSLIALALGARTWISSALMRDLEDESRAHVLKAVVLGERADVPWQVSESFRLSGTMHIFAVSGLHVGLLGLLIFELLKAFGLPRRAAIIGVIVGVVFYAFITGLRPSAVRAAVMTTVFLGGILANRPARILNSLGTAALVILLVDPRQLFRPGFQLSFLVLLSIALLAPALRANFKRWIEPDPFLPLSLLSPRQRLLGNAGGGVADYFSITTAAWLGSMPLILAYFHLISPIALVANVFIVPVAFAILFASLACLVFSAAQVPALAVIINNANYALASVMVAFVGWFAAVPGGHYFVPWEELLHRGKVRVVVLDVPGGSCPAVVHGLGPPWVIAEELSRDDLRVLRAYGRARGFPDLEEAVGKFPPGWTPLHEDHPAAGFLVAKDHRLLFLNGLSFDAEKEILERSRKELQCHVLIKGVVGADISGLPETFLAAGECIIVLGQSHTAGGNQRQRELYEQLHSPKRSVLYQGGTGAVTIEIRDRQLSARPHLKWTPPPHPRD